MSKRTATFSEKLKYRFDNLMSRGPAVTVYILSGASILFLLLFTVLYVTMESSLNDTAMGFGEVFWTNLMHLIDPGVVTEDTGKWSYKIFMLVITLAGIITLSTFIGLVSTGIMAKFNTMRKGRSRVLDSNHILIIGWSSKVHGIISELIKANENQEEPVIVILANKDKIEMEDEIKDKVPDRKHVKIICRSGNPIDLDDLEIGNPYESKSIIILDKGTEGSDVQVIKTMLAIIANPNRREAPYHVTAEITDEKNMEVARLVGKSEAELILSDEFISRIIVQTSRQSGLSVVYTDFLDFDGDELYFHDEPQLYNKTFRDALFSYNDSCIIGLHLPNGEILLNPDADFIIPEGTHVIALSEDDDKVVLYEGNKSNTQYNEDIIKTDTLDPTGPERYLILGWNHRTRIVIRELTQYIQEGSKIEIVSEVKEPIKFLSKLRKETENIEINYTKASTTSSQVIAELDLNAFDHILIQSYLDDYPLQEADAKTLITLLHLRKQKEGLEGELNIVTEMLDVNNRELAKITSVDDFIISYNIISLLMSQVAENKHLMRVFEQLFDADGQEVYIKPVKYYIETGIEMNFYVLLESALRKNEIAIGYRQMRYSQDADRNYGIVLNPVKTQRLAFEEDDCIIVLSED